VPHTRNEWIVFVAGLLVVGFLVAMIIADPNNNDPSTTAARRTLHSDTKRTTSGTTTDITTTAPTTAATTTVNTTTTKVGSVLRLQARADTWLLVRRSSSTGRLLYQGTLLAGESRTFSGTHFNVRFGAAANVTATLNGKPLPLPSGTYSVTIGRSGLGPRSA
jgi:hypothetical protein